MPATRGTPASDIRARATNSSLRRVGIGDDAIECRDQLEGPLLAHPFVGDCQRLAVFRDAVGAGAECVPIHFDPPLDRPAIGAIPDRHRARGDTGYWPAVEIDERSPLTVGDDARRALG